jgi:hypothetical protein
MRTRSTVTVVGVTGHSNLTSSSLDLVHRAIEQLLRPRAQHLVGLTCLARGADQVFAEVVLALDGDLHIVVPARDYFSGIPDTADRERCSEFLRQATSIVTMDYASSGPAAYFAASAYLIDRCEVLVAVWDGSEATDSGGTADAVSYARRNGREVLRVWPDGAGRT